MAGCYVLSLLFFSVLLSLGASQDLQFEKTFQGTSALTVTCNADTVQLPSTVSIIVEVELKSDSNTDAMSKIVQRRQFVNAVSMMNPDFILDKWKFTQPTQNQLNAVLSDNSNNRNAMSISATKDRSQCSDAGVYTCVVQYIVAGSQETKTVATNYTALGPVEVNTLQLEPQNTGNKYGDNETLTITCRAEGPENYFITWKSNNCPNFNNWPRRSGDVIKEATSLKLTTGGPDDCNTFRHMQDVEFVTDTNLNGCELICNFGKSLNTLDVESSLNVTIVVENTPATDDPTTGGSTSSASADALAIGLGVGLSLLVIIVIIILVYIFCFRKRNKEQKYGDDGRDNPDTKNTDPHAPPPVFYSKPHKPPKTEKNDVPIGGMTNIALDTSYDSKDSANRVPPRYVNSPDDNGPPYYNTDDNEPHRRRSSNDDGQENRGYSTDPDPNSDGGRRYHRRPRANRSHNSSRDYDEEPRQNDFNPQPNAHDFEPQPQAYIYDNPRNGNLSPHYYPADDHTDYGDPSMGTAI